jgi:hypothetical protein
VRYLDQADVEQVMRCTARFLENEAAIFDVDGTPRCKEPFGIVEQRI